jgi:hypothetical protein
MREKLRDTMDRMKRSNKWLTGENRELLKRNNQTDYAKWTN